MDSEISIGCISPRASRELAARNLSLRFGQRFHCDSI
jgi:hypothetical protein